MYIKAIGIWYKVYSNRMNDHKLLWNFMQWYKHDDNSLSVDTSCDDINNVNNVNVYTLTVVMRNISLSDIIYTVGRPS